MSRQLAVTVGIQKHSHTLFAVQPHGVGSIGTTSKGSQMVPALPVIQHLFPSRFVISRWMVARGGDGVRPCVVTAGAEY